ncbi:MAG TPA: hypothetical protein VMH36_01080 [Alphaproteobacteria bacterium]|nr:hypothetical protein [Alphaproteobacteria bacterium]
MNAVFLHSGWRTGSTYVWNKFRRVPSCMAFYEPFNDLLASLNAVGVLMTSRHDAALRHSGLDLPYFHEYLPLLGTKGHPLFRDEFVCRDYFVAGEKLPEQRLYLDSLLALAEKAKKTPVLGFVRSLGRVAWFKRELEGANIILIRSPFSQWVSGQKVAADGGYKFFDPVHFLILSQARGSAQAVEHALAHRIPRYENLTTNAGRLMLADTVNCAPPAVRFAVFASVYFLSMMAALPHADLVIDVDLLTTDTGYRARRRAELLRLTGCDIDFSDARTPRYGADAAPAEVVDALRTIAGAIATGQDRLWDDRSCSVPAAAAAARATIAAKFVEDSKLLNGLL